jgi:hypothetical protein
LQVSGAQVYHNRQNRAIGGARIGIAVLAPVAGEVDTRKAAIHRHLGRKSRRDNQGDIAHPGPQGHTGIALQLAAKIERIIACPTLKLRVVKLAFARFFMVTFEARSGT